MIQKKASVAGWMGAWSAAVIRLIAAGLLLTGCQGDSGSGAASGPQDGAAKSFQYPASDYFEAGPGKRGGVLRVSVSSDTNSLDMHAISHTNAQWLGRLMYDNLVYLNDKGEPTPWLARSWEISPDGKTYTFHLRDDVTFSDGAKFNAEAVRLNLEHMRDPATKSPLAAAYIAPYINGEVLDDYTFRAHLREPYAPFLDVLAQSWLAMLSPRQIKENPRQIAELPAGSGPFVVQSYTRQQGIRLVRRDDYAWAPDFLRHEGAAYLERIDIDFVPDAVIRYTSLSAGQYDLTIDAPTQNAAAIRNDARLLFDSRIRKGNPNRGITFNTEKFPFDDVNVRRAFALAVDREGIVRISGFGEYQPKSDYLAANTRYYDASFVKALQFAPDEANRLLDEAGWKERDAQGYRVKNGQRLAADVLVSGAGSLADIVAIQSDVKKVGFDLNIVQLPLAQISDRRRDNDYQALGAGVWHTNTADGLYILYHSNEIISPRRIGQNTARLRDDRLDALLAEARRSHDPATATALYSQAQQRLTELVPAVPLYENYSLTARDKKVHGVVFDTSHNTVVFTSLWLEQGGS
ncbi:peptide ABC transporter [Oxalicibacterium flavum]|uniref:Peptide ABC transporter n=1 Tax=Oxalicibacterium flavum TaxID=179467 RepID=A0A8J2XXU6_9BURK|nr:ABC transporter substrate-binding protein [Oxalicibacterium flavum]GGC16166.1 peptide ABC transporter [Oxalicibacterium flavum]